MEDWKNSDFWQKASQLHERLAKKQEIFKQNLDSYAANYDKAQAEGPESQAALDLAAAREHIMQVYQQAHGVNIYLADFMLKK